MFITPPARSFIIFCTSSHRGAIIYNLPDQIIQSVLAHFHLGPPGTQKVPPHLQIVMVTNNISPQFLGLWTVAIVEIVEMNEVV